MKKAAKQDEVTDEQGRRRFHGAFTGGFSAGYYNTVGSVEGFQPQHFVSSRGNRAATSGQDVRRFMDEEDDSLLGRGLASTKGFDTFGERGEGVAKRAANDMAQNSSIPGPAPTELLAPPSTSIGKMLLMSMGWRQGQGIGGRVARPELGYKGNASGGAMSVSFIAKRVAEGDITFAPQNTFDVVKMPPPKADFRGIGCKENGLRELLVGTRGATVAGAKRKVWRMDAVYSKGGEGDSSDDAEDSEDDEYGSSLRSSSRHLHRVEEVVLSDDDDGGGGSSLGPERARSAAAVAASVDTWVNSDGVAPSSQKCPSDGRFVLSGFVLAAAADAHLRSMSFPLPTIPKDFRPRKIFPPILEGGSGGAVRSGSAAARGVLLGESTITITRIMPPPPPPPPQAPPPPPLPSAVDSRPLLMSEAAASALQSKLGLGWTGLSEAFKNRFVASGTAPAAPTAPAAAAGPPKRMDRTTFLWTPTPLLCKRLNIASVPSSGTVPSAAPVISRVDTLFDQHIGSFLIAGGGSGDSGGGTSSSSAPPDKTVTDPLVSLEEEMLAFKNRPDMSVFKSIFESDGDGLSGASTADSRVQFKRPNTKERKPVSGLSFADDDDEDGAARAAVVLSKEQLYAKEREPDASGGKLVNFAEKKRVRSKMRSALPSDSDSDSNSNKPLQSSREGTEKKLEKQANHEKGEEDKSKKQKKDSRWDR